jgi:hypothetical protein
MVGAWKRLIESVKRATRHILWEDKPAEEVLHTVLTKIEHIINVRPLTYVSIDL